MPVTHREPILATVLQMVKFKHPEMMPPARCVKIKLSYRSPVALLPLRAKISRIIAKRFCGASLVYAQRRHHDISHHILQEPGWPPKLIPPEKEPQPAFAKQIRFYRWCGSAYELIPAPTAAEQVYALCGSLSENSLLPEKDLVLSLIHLCRCRRSPLCRSPSSPHHHTITIDHD